MDIVGDITQWAGVLALGAFAGTLLGGIALGFFWNNFGPWKLLEACRAECLKHHEEREEDRKETDRQMAIINHDLSDLTARHQILLQAIERGGLGLQLGPNKKETP